MKKFEQFTNDSYEMQSILDKLQKRISYWFQSGEFSMRSNLIDTDVPKSTSAARRSIIVNFSDDEFYYQLIIRMNIEDLEHCDVIIKKYDPSQIDIPGGGRPIETLELTNDKKVEINDIKEDFIVKKLSEIEDMKKNPDKNKIEAPKSQSTTPSQGAQQGAQQGAPPEAGGGSEMATAPAGGEAGAPPML